MSPPETTLEVGRAPVVRLRDPPSEHGPMGTRGGPPAHVPRQPPGDAPRAEASVPALRERASPARAGAAPGAADGRVRMPLSATMRKVSVQPDRTEQDRWLGVEIRHLAALRAVAEEGTFGAAALKLGYAQSAISQQIAALERHVGRRLFDRPGGSRPVTLTRAGELLLEHAESIMARLAAARIDLDSLADEDVDRPIRVGAYQTVASVILPLILQELGADPGEVEFDLHESNDDTELLRPLER